MNKIYYKVSKLENFEVAARKIFNLLVEAQNQFENESRVLKVDIDNHLNELGQFDDDMLRLQQEFGELFLLPFFTEINFPLLIKKNPQKQINDIPEKFTLNNLKRETSLTELEIKNYYNTEFVLEKDVYLYLKKVSNVLKEYIKIDNYKINIDREDYDEFGLLIQWQSYMKDLINELYNSFINGNLISNVAMTRSLIECYVYISIIKKEKNPLLLQDWFFSNLIKGSKRYNEGNKELLNNTLAQFFEGYDILQSRLKKGNSNNWLSTVIPKKNITFRDACEYLNEDYIYEDFQEASSFVHGQDIKSKITPFFSYSSIYSKLYTMMIYIIKSLYLFDLSSELKEEIDDLEFELILLGKKYL
ncbi:hypothetical protein HB800_04185 [Listeria welshimeri]|nr:hypothetical protein [Listeria welshimeri]